MSASNGSVASATWQQVELARHPDRPYVLDYIHAIFPNFFELHGDLLHRVLQVHAGRFQLLDQVGPVQQFEGRHPLAGQRAPLNPLACSRRWTPPMAGRIDPVPRR